MERLHEVRLVGPGMHRLTAAQVNTPPRVPSARWSRAAGALGEATWRRLVQLRAAVVGCGRTGSQVATSLVRLGMRRLLLVDPDLMEAANLDAMSTVLPTDVGRPKVVALSRRLRRLNPGADVAGLRCSVTSLRALPALRRCHAYFCCVDHDGARLATAALATLFARPLVDIGTGVFRDGRGTRRLGADVRLVIPGERRCLLCFGGLADEAGARESLARPLGAAPDPEAWRRQRAGSLRSLNGVAAHLGLRLFEELVDGRLGQSTWLHLEWGPAGVPGLQVPVPARPAACPLCRLAGQGDEGVAEVGRVLASDLLLP